MATISGGGAGLRSGGAQAGHPFGKAAREQLAVDGIDDVVERVMARDAVGERQEAAKKVDVQPSPASDLHEILRPGDGAAQHSHVRHFK